MKTKILFWIFAFICLSFLAFAAESTFIEDYIKFDNATVNTFGNITLGDLWTSHGYQRYTTGTDNAYYGVDAQANPILVLPITSATDAGYNISIRSSASDKKVNQTYCQSIEVQRNGSGANYYAAMKWSNASDGNHEVLIDFNAAIRWVDQHADVTTDCTGQTAVAGAVTTGFDYNFTFCFTNDTYISGMLNTTSFTKNCTLNQPYNWTSLELFTTDNGGAGPSQFIIRSWSVYNGTVKPTTLPPPPPDTTPSQITFCNMTSEGGSGYVVNLSDPFCSNAGCKVPRTNDTTPTLICTIDEQGNLTIINSNRNLNYTDIYRGTANNGNGTGKTIAVTLNDSNSSRIGLRNFSLSATDTSGNQNLSATLFFYINITDSAAPNTTLNYPNSSGSFAIGINNTIDFNFTSIDNLDSNFTCVGYLDNVLLFTNSSYLNGTMMRYTSAVSTTGSHTFYVNCTDSYNNINQSEIRSFSVNNPAVNFSLNEYANRTLVYTGLNTIFNFTVNFTEKIDKCYLYVNNAINQSNNSLIRSRIKYNLTSNLSIGYDYNWSVKCNLSSGLLVNSSYFELYVYNLPNISFTAPTPDNNTITTNQWVLINVSTIGKIQNYTLEWNGTNQSITFNNTLNLVINKTGLSDLTVYNFKVYVNDSNHNINSTEMRFISINVFKLTVVISSEANFTFKPYVVNSTLRTVNISCSGQTDSIGCLNFSNFGTYNLNLSLMFNITVDPNNQKIIEDFSANALNWTTYQQRANNTINQSLVNASVACGEIQSLNGTGILEYRFNNTAEMVYINSTNSSTIINLTFNCPSINYFTRILNVTQMNITGFDSFNFTWRGDNTTNRFNITLINSVGTRASSTALTLSNQGWNLSGIPLGSLRNISTINISVMNVSGTSGLSGFFIDNLKLINTSSNQSGNIKMKAGCTNNYANTTILPANEWTLMCGLNANVTTKYIWLYQDVNLTKKGISWRLKYNVSIIN